LPISRASSFLPLPITTLLTSLCVFCLLTHECVVDSVTLVVVEGVIVVAAGTAHTATIFFTAAVLGLEWIR
jgi:hypothetical protein